MPLIGIARPLAVRNVECSLIATQIFICYFYFFVIFISNNYGFSYNMFGFYRVAINRLQTVLSLDDTFFNTTESGITMLLSTLQS